MLWFRIATLALIMLLPYAPARSYSQMSTEAVPVIDVDSGCLLGGSLNGKWLKAEEMSTRMSGGDRYRLYDLNGEWKVMTGGKPASQGAPCEDTLYVEIPSEIQDGRSQGVSYIGVAGKWNALPRKPIIESTNNPVYRKAVASLLMKKGIRHPEVIITKILRVDLEGDGVDEVIINASRVNRWENGSITTDASAGDYSIVMLRKVINGKVETIMLDEEYHIKPTKFSAPNEFTLTAVLDLNGDGVMEIIDAGGYYEGDWKTVYSIQGNKAVDVMGCGCGA